MIEIGSFAEMHDVCCFTKGKLVRGFDESGNSNTTGFTCFSMHVDDKFLGVSSLQELAEFENMLKQRTFNTP